MKLEWPKVTVEFLSILLGVSLAFAASEWQEEREKEQRAHHALLAVYHELQDNRRVLANIHKNNAATVALMQGASGADQDANFIPGIQLQSSAWDTVKTTGVGHYLPYQTLMALSRCYALLDVYVSTGHKLTDSAMTMAAFATVTRKAVDNEIYQEQFGSYFEMIVTVEEQLLQEIDAAMDYLKQHHQFL
jgi:hypothetical protein